MFTKIATLALVLIVAAPASATKIFRLSTDDCIKECSKELDYCKENDPDANCSSIYKDCSNNC